MAQQQIPLATGIAKGTRWNRTPRWDDHLHWQINILMGQCFGDRKVLFDALLDTLNEFYKASYDMKDIEMQIILRTCKRLDTTQECNAMRLAEKKYERIKESLMQQMNEIRGEEVE